MKSRRILAVLLILCLGTGLVHAATTINISSFANQTWCPDFGNCSTLPFASKPTTASLSSFQETRMGRRTTFGGLMWRQEGAAVRSRSRSGQRAKVKTVYTLMNTTDGSTESGLLSITFTGSGGATWTVDLSAI